MDDNRKNISKGKILEVLSPAGDSERFENAVRYGADAVYLAGTKFGMRAAPSNFTHRQLKQACDFAHSRDVKVYLTCNTVPRNDEIEEIPDFLRQAAAAGVDAFIICDIGVMRLAQKYAPDVDIHISTQAGICNYAAANEFWTMGAKRVVLARELSLEDISRIRDKTDPALELETFVHGAMCVSFSGRCLLSAYMTGRDANRGDCAQPCRWNYALVEKGKREGEYFPVDESDGGTYILNSRDMCMINHIDKLAEAGVYSLKIEGRAKSAYYTAVSTYAYRAAVDEYMKAPDSFILPEWIAEEVNKVSHREYSTGFFFGEEPGQIVDNGGYIREYNVVGIVENSGDGYLHISQRNKFCKGDILDVMVPGRQSFCIPVPLICDENDVEIESAPHAMMKVKIPYNGVIAEGAYLRKRNEG